MGYKTKMAEGLVATGGFGPGDVSKLIGDIVEAMDKKATILSDDGDGNLLLGFAMSGAQKAMHFNVLSAAASALTKSIDVDLTANVSIRTTGGATEVETTIKEASTSQMKGLGFIPVSPKAVLGITTYREFNEHLKDGLLRIDSGAEIQISEQG
jgi:hypothetical protein